MGFFLSGVIWGGHRYINGFGFVKCRLEVAFGVGGDGLLDDFGFGYFGIIDPAFEDNIGIGNRGLVAGAFDVSVDVYVAIVAVASDEREEAEYRRHYF